MSDRLISAAFAYAIEPADKLVLIALAHMAGPDGLCRIPPRELAALCGLELADVRQSLAYLARQEFIAPHATSAGPAFDVLKDPRSVGIVP